MPSRAAVLAVDHQRGLEPPVLLVAVDVDELRQRAQRCSSTWSPGVELVEVVALQRVLILRVAGRPPMRRSCIAWRKAGAPGTRRSLAAQARDHLVAR